MIQLYRYLILGACLLVMAEGLSQQVTIFNSSITNPYSINPAKAGEKGNQLFIQHRNQWVDIPGSPENTMLTTEWRLKESKVAIGFKLSNDVDNIIKTNSGYFTYAYHTQLGGKHSLSAGLSFGAKNNTIMFDKIFVEEESDPSVFGYNQSGTKFNADFGMSYKYDAFEFQFAGLQLLGNNATYFNAETEEMFEYQYVRNFVSSAAYTFSQVKDFEFTPILQVRGVQGFNLQPEFIAKAEYLEQFWLAGHYNHNRSVAFSMGVLFQDVYTVSYSAEVSTHELVGYNGGTHEIVFGIKFGNAFDRTQTRRKLEKIEKSTNSYNERLEFIKRENDKLKKQMEEQKKYYEQSKENSESKNYNELKEEIEKLKKEHQGLILHPSQGNDSNEELKQLIEQKAGNIEFEKGKTVLKKSSFNALDKMVASLKENPKAKIIIEGHTDNTGSEKINLEVSTQRAKTVKEYLVEEGVAASQISVIGKGASEPIADNTISRGRKENRRVEIVLVN